MERLDGTVRRALRSSGVPDAGQLAEVTRVWPEAVGPATTMAGVVTVHPVQARKEKSVYNRSRTLSARKNPCATSPL